MIPFPSKNGGEKLKTDLLPLISRIPALEDAESVKWASGLLGNPDFPGPSSYWIDALVELKESSALRARSLANEVVFPEGLHPLVAECVPQATFLSSSRLNDLFSGKQWWASAFIASDRPILVLSMVGR